MIVLIRDNETGIICRAATRLTPEQFDREFNRVFGERLSYRVIEFHHGVRGKRMCRQLEGFDPKEVLRIRQEGRVPR